MKKKVVEYIARIQDGGAETLVKDYALFLDKEKFDVTVLCEDYKKDSANYKQLLENNIKMISLYEPNFFINKVIQRIIGQKHVGRLLKKELEKICPDILHVHLESLEATYYARDVLKNTKLLFTCHNVPELKIGDKRPKERDACKYLLKNNNLQIIALHEDMKNEINKMFNINSTIVIKNGIDINKFKNVSKTSKQIRKELGIAEDAYVIGHIGRFTYQKNHEFIVKVFNEAIKLNNKAFLLLIGEGKEKTTIENKLKELNTNNYLILSRRKNIPELLKAMDVFLLPSRYEGLSVAYVEAQASGLPSVVSDTINPESFLSNNITKLSLENDIEEWANSCLNPKANISDYGNIYEYDISKEIKTLENLYL